MKYDTNPQLHALLFTEFHPSKLPLIGNLSLIPPKNGWHLMIPVKTPSQKPTWLAGKSPCSIGNTSTHSWWIFQPSHVSFREGIFAKFWVLEKGISFQTMGNLGYQFVKFRRDSAWTPRVAPVLNAEKISVPSLSQTGRVWGSCYSDPWSFIIHISHIKVTTKQQMGED